ncbi:hypothetical protein GL218_01359 [Daldinia childiae]|uniref:uncharacterized protein n=1 Tax=Daldinia childiae TaxID=326645 RepID=UPI0014456618|nr:uncharacterized protein GL218_01359 [Daldinia childiae]KAF3063604.1 hypothetical protein GL218_01359 [Daldinia childiae]
MVRGVGQLLGFSRKRILDETPPPAPVPVPIDPARCKMEQRVPLASEILDHPDSINSQLQSPLFGKLPRELRDLIWRFSLTRYEDLDQLYDIQKPYARPGQAAPLRVAVQLLQTCRAVYVEAFLTPFQVNPIVVFHGNNNDIPPGIPLMRTTEDQVLCRKLRFWQFANISSVEITLQQVNLEGGGLERVSRLIGTIGRHHGHESRGYAVTGYASFVSPTEPDRSTSEADSKEEYNNQLSSLPNPLIGRKITRLSIRMSRTDWWGWESRPDEGDVSPSARLRLEPMINVTDLWKRPANYLAMTKGYEARKAGNEPDFQLDDFEKQGRWGSQIREYWPDLTTLELVLETFSCKKNQLDNVVQCAKLWTFPLEDGFHLAWNGKEELIRWRGAQSYKYEHYDWFRAHNVPQATEAQSSEAIQWRPSQRSSRSDKNSQEFIIQTLTFERKRVEGYTDADRS